MNRKKNRRIESNPELVAMLQAAGTITRADAVILYNYIDIKQIEISEIFSLMDKSQMVENTFKGSGESMIDDQFRKKMETCLEKYKTGNLERADYIDYEDFIKENIRILRFDDIAEKDPEHSRWVFDYKKRPPKYIVLRDEILQKEALVKYGIPNEGVTAFFMRFRNMIRNDYLANEINNLLNSRNISDDKLKEKIKDRFTDILVNESLAVIKKKITAGNSPAKKNNPGSLLYGIFHEMKYKKPDEELQNMLYWNYMELQRLRNDKIDKILNKESGNKLDDKLCNSLTNKFSELYKNEFEEELNEEAKQKIVDILKSETDELNELSQRALRFKLGGILNRKPGEDVQSKLNIKLDEVLNTPENNDIKERLLKGISNDTGIEEGDELYGFLSEVTGRITDEELVKIKKNSIYAMQKELREILNTKSVKETDNELHKRIDAELLRELSGILEAKLDQKGAEEKNALIGNNYLILTRDGINALPAHKKPDPNNTTEYINYDSHHAAWILLEKSDEKGKESTGCIRLEFYSDGKVELEQIEKRVVKIASSEVLELITQEIGVVETNTFEYSYDKLYNCIDALMENIIIIAADLRKSKYNEKINSRKEKFRELEKINLLLEHLFYVFKRNTYHGDAIIDRIENFINDLLETLKLPNKLLMGIWINLQKHEELMLYNIEEYRDHLMHQFHVFVTGYIIIYRYGIDRFLELLNDNYSGKIKIEDGSQVFNELDVLRIWALTALFHDCGYIFEKLPKGFNEFTKRVLHSELDVHVEWNDFFIEQDNVSEFLRVISRYFNHCENYSEYFEQDSLFRIFLKNSVIKNDHGILSAAILYQHISKHYHDSGKTDNIDFIIRIAALAISVHNSNVFNDIKTKTDGFICFKKNPFAYLLILCDTVQEWGRKKNIDVSKKIANPELKFIRAESCGKGKKFNMELNYSQRMEGKRPDRLTIYEKTSHLFSTLRSPEDIMFQIEYLIYGSDRFSVLFDTCYDKCGAQCGKNDRQNESLK